MDKFWFLYDCAFFVFIGAITLTHFSQGAVWYIHLVDILLCAWATFSLSVQLRKKDKNEQN